MSMNSTIEWTDATWNPVRGCSIVSKGCTNCYAMRQAHRFSGVGKPYEGLTKLTKGGPVWTGKVRFVHELLDAPLHWRKPRRIFINSMSDLFHEDVDAVSIGSVLGIAAACPQHTFQVLTKRPQRMLDILRSEKFLDAYETSEAMYTHNETPWPPANVWLGVSVEDQASADERIPLLLQTPAAVRWISAEPLLGPITLRREISSKSGPTPCAPESWEVSDWLSGWRGSLDHKRHGAGHASPGLNWVVAGGESGPGARPSHPDWFRSLRDQCAAVGVPYFFKQWGAWLPWGQNAAALERHRLQPSPAIRYDEEGDRYSCTSELLSNPLCQIFNVGKRAAGRVLDGRTHDEYPA